MTHKYELEDLKKELFMIEGKLGEAWDEFTISGSDESRKAINKWSEARAITKRRIYKISSENVR